MKESQTPRLTMKEWAKDDRPREKMLQKGTGAMSDAELLAILIGSGNNEETAVDLSRRILADNENSLAILGKMSIKDLMNYNGIGEAKAITILAACELGKRRQRSAMPEKPILDNAKAIYDYMHPVMRDLKKEEAHLLLLKSNFQLLKHIKLSSGGITETSIDVRTILKEALLTEATIIALVHNHPSGKASPSRQDDNLTQYTLEACKSMRIYLADHIIITDGDYYSYRENQKI